MGNFVDDAAKGAAAGFSLGQRGAGRKRLPAEDKSADAPPPPAAGDAEAPAFGLYRKGGYVAARASGKRDYPKGKSCGC